MLASDYECDALNRLVELTQTTSAPSEEPSLDNVTYDYYLDLFGKRIGADEYYEQDGRTDSYSWVYDGLGRLVEETLDYDGGSEHDFIAQYRFDFVGNRLDKTLDRGMDSVVDEAIAYLYDRNDRLLREQKDDLTYTDEDETTFYKYGASNERTEQSLF